MRYKGYDYNVVQTANPTGWKWTVQLDETRTKVGSASSRDFAILFAKRAIEKAAKPKTAGRNGVGEVEDLRSIKARN
jgi:hypothetical protein